MLDRQELEEIRLGRRTPEGLASIVVPHYQTAELAILCLRAIRRLTDHPYEAIVVDNHSEDGSLEALRRVAWIRLIERGAETESNPVLAHAAAMDIGMAAARGRWLVSFHTDTIVRKPGWLDALVGRLEANPRAAAIGADKLDTDPGWYRGMKRLGNWRPLKAFLRRVTGLPANPRYAPGPWYPRSFCAVYRLDLVRQLGLNWQPDYEGVQLTSDEMHVYVEHVAHATAYLGRGGVRHWRGNAKARAALRRVMESDLACELLSDDSLDR